MKVKLLRYYEIVTIIYFPIVASSRFTNNKIVVIYVTLFVTLFPLGMNAQASISDAYSINVA